MFYQGNIAVNYFDWKVAARIIAFHTILCIAYITPADHQYPRSCWAIMERWTLRFNRQTCLCITFSRWEMVENTPNRWNTHYRSVKWPADIVTWNTSWKIGESRQKKAYGESSLFIIIYTSFFYSVPFLQRVHSLHLLPLLVSLLPYTSSIFALPHPDLCTPANRLVAISQLAWAPSSASATTFSTAFVFPLLLSFIPVCRSTFQAACLPARRLKAP